VTQHDPTPAIPIANGGPSAVASSVPARRSGADSTSHPRHLLCRFGGFATKPFCNETRWGNGLKDG